MRKHIAPWLADPEPLVIYEQYEAPASLLQIPADSGQQGHLLYRNAKSIHIHFGVHAQPAYGLTYYQQHPEGKVLVIFSERVWQQYVARIGRERHQEARSFLFSRLGTDFHLEKELITPSYRVYYGRYQGLPPEPSLGKVPGQ